jgi:hypothetical protein
MKFNDFHVEIHFQEHFLHHVHTCYNRIMGQFAVPEGTFTCVSIIISTIIIDLTMIETMMIDLIMIETCH